MSDEEPPPLHRRAFAGSPLAPRANAGSRVLMFWPTGQSLPQRLWFRRRFISGLPSFLHCANFALEALGSAENNVSRSRAVAFEHVAGATPIRVAMLCTLRDDHRPIKDGGPRFGRPCRICILQRRSILQGCNFAATCVCLACASGRH